MMTIAPDPVYSNIPFEALMIDDSTYLVEKFDIGYVQSSTVLAMLQNRAYEKLERRVLTIGNPYYEPVTFTKLPFDELIWYPALNLERLDLI